MALRSFDQPPASPNGILLKRNPLRDVARQLIEAYRVKTPRPRRADQGPVRRQRSARRAGARALQRRRSF